MHCCTDCVQSAGQQHTHTCQRRQDLAFVVTGTARSSETVSNLDDAGAAVVSTAAGSSTEMDALSSLAAVRCRDAAGAMGETTSTERKPLSVNGSEAIEVSSDESSEESSGDFMLISATGGATAKMAESSSIAATPKSTPLYEAGSGICLNMMD